MEVPLAYKPNLKPLSFFYFLYKKSDYETKNFDFEFHKTTQLYPKLNTDSESNISFPANQALYE